MAKYKVAWDYTSNIGSFDKGAVVEVDDELADHVNRDSPGVLKPVKDAKKQKDTPPAANAGSVDEVLARVGEDPDQAAEALEAEQAASNPRSTLIAGLEAVLAGSDEDNAGDA